MKSYSVPTFLCALVSLAAAGQPAPFSVTGPVFYGDAPDEHHAWAVHDRNRAQPPIVTPGTFSTQDQAGKPPSDAIILYDGTDLSKWEADTGVNVPTKWVINKGAMECVPGSGQIRTKEKFGDCQLHVEWSAPTPPHGDSQGRGNSGVFLMGLVEIQVLDNYNNPTYPDGAAGSVYGQHAAMANPLHPPGEFQVYDIVFRRPIYKDGKEVDPGYVTVFANGVLMQDHAVIEGETGHQARTKFRIFPESGPLKLQDHGNPVRYRNIWYRPLPPRASQGGSDGYLSSEDTIARRKEIAASIREDAPKQPNELDQMLRFAESLVYDVDDATLQQVEKMAGKYVADIKQLPPDKLSGKRDEVKRVRDDFRYMARFKIIPADFGPKKDIDQLVKDQNWDRRGN